MFMCSKFYDLFLKIKRYHLSEFNWSILSVEWNEKTHLVFIVHFYKDTKQYLLKMEIHQFG